jgi:hypothetical protein
MKKILLALACAAVAPLAFAQTGSTTTTQSTATNPATGTTETTSTDGTVITFEPGKTIVMRGIGANDPISFALGPAVHYLNKAGREIEASMIRPGARVHVYYDRAGGTQIVVHRVVVDED